MTAKWYETVTGSLQQKKQYRESMARMRALPDPYREVAEAYHRYFTASGGISDGETLVRMLEGFVELWEQAAADGTGVRAVVGEDPVGFGEDFLRAYGGRDWRDKERDRLRAAVAEAEGTQ